MNQTKLKPIPRVFVDADVLFAGSASPSEHSASQVVLRMAEITLIEAFISEQVFTEVERNLAAKLPQALPNFRHLVARCLQIVPNPTIELIKAHQGKAEPKDLPILVAAAREKCNWLVTFNLAHYQPGLKEVSVLKPGSFILLVRDLLLQLT
ncbi:PIN domain-containing protein [Candidatus Leptofilum sp.]|uniref:PIN domain-containing protein n=1 Tax=Candidatus Leptofilum sp. TaxID=3241576 RepID=UPI003B5A8E94